MDKPRHGTPAGGSPIRILHLITGLSMGGAETALMRLLGATDRSRFTPTVVSLTDGGALASPIGDLGIPVITLGMRRGAPSPAGLVRLRRVVREARPDIVQGWMYHANLAASLAGWEAGRIQRRPVPTVWNVRCHDWDQIAAESRLTAAVMRLSAALSCRADRIIYNAHSATVSHQAHGFDPRRTVVIPNGVDCAAYRPSPEARVAVRRRLGVGDDVPLVGLIARFHPLKDHPTFLRAAAALAQGFPEAQFLVAGSGVADSNPDFAALADRFGVGARLHALGERRDIPALTAALDVAVSSSTTEGFSNTVCEAMACGVPCVVTDVGDSAEIVGETGVVVPPSDPAALRAGIETLLREGPHDRSRRGAAARARVLDRYSLKGMVRRYQHLYEQVLDLPTAREPRPAAKEAVAVLDPPFPGRSR